VQRRLQAWKKGRRMSGHQPKNLGGPVNRRTVLTGIAAGASAVLGSPYIARAQEGDIPIGVLLPFTGSQGAYGADMRRAAELTTKLINDAGGILGGRKFKLYFEDDESTPTAGLIATKKLLEINKCQAIIGVWGSPIAVAIKTTTLQANACLMVSGAANAITEGDTKGLVWRFQAKATDWGPGMARAMISRGWRKTSILAQQNAFIIPMIEPAKIEFEKAGGKVFDTVIYNPNQPSYRAEVQRIFNSGKPLDAVMCLGLLTDFVSIVREVRRNSYSTKIMALSIAADAEGQFIKAVGPKLAEGIEHFQPAPPLQSPSYKRFLKLMGASPDTIYFFAGNTHDQICTLALAMEKAKSTDPLVYTKVIREVCNPPGEEVDDELKALALVRRGVKINFNGAGSICDFDAQGDQLNRHYAHFRIENGKSVLVQTLKGPEAKI
jgi:branched-chain amino acid transport system substrate-binding protein